YLSFIQIMQCKEGKPPHSLSEYFYIIPNEWANKSNRKCICRACMDAVGKEFALKDDNLKITNTKRYCANHLRDCPYFATKYLPEQIQLILNSATLSPPNKQVMISYTDEEDEDENDSTSGITSNSLASSNTLKKQTTLSKYVGRSLTASEIPKFECLTLVTKDDVASDNDLKLLTEIKIAINRDPFWDSLTILHKLLCPFCEALDLTQRDNTCLHNVLHTFGFFIQIFKELEESQFQTRMVKRLEKSQSDYSSSAAPVSASSSLSNQDLEFEETNTDDINEEITSEIDWNVAINKWEELLIDEEFEEEQDDLDIANINFLDSETHLAENQAAK
ncbi:760_t:CDS:2, partial [Dentiscutata heterogama]